MTENPKSKQVIINVCFGGFSISDEACEWLVKNKGWKITEFTKDGKEYKDKTAQIVKSTYGPESSMPKYWLCNDKREESIRENKDIIACIKKLGDKANGHCAKLKIVEIPSNIEYEIDEYDGNESIHEVHRSWS